MIKSIKKERIIALLDKLIQKYQVFGPTWQDHMTRFTELKRGKEANLEFYNSQRPPKELFFPQSEKLFSYTREEREVRPEAEGKKRVIFGLRPCDAKALSLLDKVFDAPDYKDPYYVGKRENTIVCSLACNYPQISCFCLSFNGGPFSREGADILMVDLGGKYIFESVTPKGDDLLREMDGLLQETEESDITRAKELEKEAKSRIGPEIKIEGLSERLAGMFDNPIWDEIHQKCLGCGACTYLCPTCHCFDIVDEAVDSKGQRIRNWDSCMFPDFTLEASGYNPRPTNKERMRQRIMHKFNYFKENYGDFACVGCGRCLRNCPVNMDIREVINLLAGYEGD